MKYQFMVLKLMLKRYKKLLLLILFFLICMVCVTYINSPHINMDTFNTIIGIAKIEKYTFLDYLWNGFQIIVVFFLLYYFFSYEENNSIEFLILRKNYHVFLFNKLIISIIMVIIFRIIIYILVYISFYSYVSFSLKTLLISAIYYIFIVICSFIFSAVKRKI